jgi:23S rRNA G2069 N7-methylase RlmK/C1962 C5-methylase RlmI
LKEAAARLKARRPERARHPWIFAGEIASLPECVADGEILRVLDQRGRFLALAYVNRKSKIVLRVLAWDDEPLDDGFWHRRVARAVMARGRREPDARRRQLNAEGSHARSWSSRRHMASTSAAMFPNARWRGSKRRPA